MQPQKCRSSLWLTLVGILVGGGLVASSPAQAFCGYFVAKAGSELFNKASRVVLVRDEDRTVITMANDYQGNASEFAMVVPVPTVLEKSQINVGENAWVDRVDGFTAPRLAEYFDPDPCQTRFYMERAMSMQNAPGAPMKKARNKSAKSLGVKIEATYEVGEYDILILSAKQSDGLQTWLIENGYKIPRKATKILRSYIKQGMKFFVAKINIGRQEKAGRQMLRPLQIAYESKRFMLPIRLGTLNAKGHQDLFVYAITKKGRVESTNYQNTRIPTGQEIPVFVKKDFANFYRAMFDKQVEKDHMKTVITEYAWNMGWCDPCAADPLSSKELKQLGVFWLGQKDLSTKKNGFGLVKPNPRIRRPRPGGRGQEAFVTRMHVRYTAKKFPEDLLFQVTKDTKNFQGRYVLRHPFRGESKCELAKEYKVTVRKQQEKRVQELANLTGWMPADLRRKVAWVGGKPADNGADKKKKKDKWWQGIW